MWGEDTGTRLILQGRLAGSLGRLGEGLRLKVVASSLIVGLVETGFVVFETSDIDSSGFLTSELDVLEVTFTQVSTPGLGWVGFNPMFRSLPVSLALFDRVAESLSRSGSGLDFTGWVILEFIGSILFGRTKEAFNLVNSLLFTTGF